MNVLEVLGLIGVVIGSMYMVNDHLLPVVKTSFRKKEDVDAKAKQEASTRPIGKLISDLDRKYGVDSEHSGAGPTKEE